MDEEVRRKRKKDNLGIRLLKRFLILISIIGILALIFIFAFRITNINIDGNIRYSDAEIKKIVGIADDFDNTVVYYYNHRNITYDNISFIESINIEWGGRNTINIHVVEKVIVGCIGNNGIYLYFDNYGLIVESSTVKQEDIPLVMGLGSDETVTGDILDVEEPGIFNDLLSLSLLLNKHELAPEYVSVREDWTLALKLGEITALLGYSNDMEDKVAGMKDVISHLEGKKGILHLENYDSTKDSIIFSEES